jgi:alanine racemase
MTEKIQHHFDYPIMRHILNSAGIERFPQYAFDMVRLGIGLHGISADGAALQPVSSFKSYIASIRHVSKESTVGYGRKGVLHRDSIIAVIPVGYADGLNRHLSCGVGEMSVRGNRAPIVGNICMDACMIDVTDIDAQVGDEVEIFGKQISVKELAEKLETIPYEILTNVSHRVKRVYFKE